MEIWSTESGKKLFYFSYSELTKQLAKGLIDEEICAALRINILSSVQCAGSGHIGTSFSSVEIFWAIRKYMGLSLPNRNDSSYVCFSSKGHDAPAIYALMHLFGEVRDSEIFKLRRLGGLPGHPEIITPGIPTNTGSLGMGISKAKGFIYANRLKKRNQKVFVILGDGELQEGQIWESMLGASRDSMHELIVIVDANRIQSDSWVDKILPLGDLEKRVRAVGWDFHDINGNDVEELISSFKSSEQFSNPTFIVANTLKGKGVGFMEKFPEEGKFYKYHSGAISETHYIAAISEIAKKLPLLDESLESLLDTVQISQISDSNHNVPKTVPNLLASRWANLLVSEMEKDESIIVLDGDLSFDTGTYKVASKYPERYIQSGIAEQDMVSVAGTLALSGFTPIVHSFATFLSMRPNEQIFNNATEGTKIIYAGFLAGVIPSAPGFSHQAVTDVPAFMSFPNVQILEPSCACELKEALSGALTSDGSTYIRIGSGDFFEGNSCPTGCNPNQLKLVERHPGGMYAIVTSGPTMLMEAIRAAESLNDCGISTAVYSRMSLNGKMLDTEIETLERFSHIVVVENYLPALTTFELLKNRINPVKISRLGVNHFPVNGQRDEVLAELGLNYGAISRLIESIHEKN